MKTRKIIVSWGPVVVWMGVIFALSSQPSLPRFPFVVPDKVFKKSGHFVEYAILAGLCWRALRQTGRTRYPAIWAFVITVLYATSDEWHQTFVPGRNGRPLDVLIDAAGALTSLTALHLWKRSQSGAGSARRPAPDQAASPASTRDPEIADEA